jgi:hypothetical protein
LMRRLGRRISSKAGWRVIGKQRCYFRSKMEANYARYLEWLRQRGEIASWHHEPETFWFKGIKRGCVSYLVDYKVVDADGSVWYAEVKGYMDNRSKTKLKRMAKYFPDVKLILIDSVNYSSIQRTVSKLIKDWE